MASQFSGEVGERSSDDGRRRKTTEGGERSWSEKRGAMEGAGTANERTPCGAGSGAGRAGQGGTAREDFGASSVQILVCF